MNISPELRDWFLDYIRAQISNSVSWFNAQDWDTLAPNEDVPVATYWTEYKDVQNEMDHITCTYPETILEYFTRNGCCIKGMHREKRHLMTQLRDGAISFKMLFPAQR